MVAGNGRRRHHATQAGLWMLACAAFYTAETGIIRALGPGWPSPVTLFWREIAACAGLVPVVLHLRGAPLRTTNHGALLFRSATGTLGLLLSIYAIARLPLAAATTLAFTRPMWIALLAAIFLSERMNPWRALSLLVGFSGVLWIVRPGGNIADPVAALSDLAAAFLFAASLVSIRYLAASDSPLTILVYGQLLGLIFTTPLAIYNWRAPDWQELCILLSVGVVSLGTTISYIKALHCADASVVGPMEYLRLPFAMIAGLWLLDEVPTRATMTGAALILAGAAMGILGGKRHKGSKEQAGPKRDSPLPGAIMSVAEIKSHLFAQLEEQEREARAHRANPYWTDSRTGRNVSVDEFEAIRMMEWVAGEPSKAERLEPSLYAARLLADLSALSDKYRATADDPDGYGIATIGTVIRNLTSALNAKTMP